MRSVGVRRPPTRAIARASEQVSASGGAAVHACTPHAKPMAGPLRTPATHPTSGRVCACRRCLKWRRVDLKLGGVGASCGTGASWAAASLGNCLLVLGLLVTPLVPLERSCNVDANRCDGMWFPRKEHHAPPRKTTSMEVATRDMRSIDSVGATCSLRLAAAGPPRLRLHNTCGA